MSRRTYYSSEWSDSSKTRRARIGRKNKFSSSSLTNGFVSNRHFIRASRINFCLFWTIILQLALFHVYVLTQQLSTNSMSYQTIYQCYTYGCAIWSIYSANDLMEVYLDENSKSGMVSLVFKMLSFCVVPLPCLNNWTYVNYDYYNQISFPDKYNYLLILLSIPRLGFCVSYLFARSKFMTPRAIRICKLHGAQPGLVYCLKSIFKDNSFILVSTIFIASLILFSFAFRIAYLDFNNIGIKATYENFFWMTLITMTTVGYGDFAPRTVLGRLTACLCASWGVLIMSIMVVVLTETFYLQKSILNDYLGYWSSLSLLKKLESKRNLRVFAGKYIRYALWRVWENYKYKKNLSSGMLERKLKDKFHITLRIEKLNLGSRNEYDIFNEMFRLFERTLLEISCLTDNNLMLIDCLHSQYIFTDDPFIELSRTKSHQY